MVEYRSQNGTFYDYKTMTYSYKVGNGALVKFPKDVTRKQGYAIIPPNSGYRYKINEREFTVGFLKQFLQGLHPYKLPTTTLDRVVTGIRYDNPNGTAGIKNLFRAGAYMKHESSGDVATGISLTAFYTDFETDITIELTAKNNGNRADIKKTIRTSVGIRTLQNGNNQALIALPAETELNNVPVKNPAEPFVNTTINIHFLGVKICAVGEHATQAKKDEVLAYNIHAFTKDVTPEYKNTIYAQGSQIRL
jgi:hypothetical protein